MRLEKRGTMVVACLVFLGLGILMASVGPALPTLAAQTQSTPGELGGIFSAIFLGTLLTQFVAGTIGDRYGQRPLLFAGILFMVIGMSAIAFGRSLLIVQGGALIAGIGNGAIVAGANVLVAKVFAPRSAAPLNLANVFYGVGAIAGPAIAGITLRLWNTPLPAIWIGGILLLLCLPLLPMILNPIAAEQRTGDLGVLREPILWLLSILILIYVGTEVGLGGWAATYLESSTSLIASDAALVVSSFWLAFTLGRMIATFLGTRMSPEALLMLSASGAALSAILLPLSTGNLLFTTIALLGVGLCFGPIYPTAMAITAERFHRSAGIATSVFMIFGSAGGSLLPLIQGLLFQYGGEIIGITQTTIGALIIFFIQLWIWRTQRQPEQSQSGTIEPSPAPHS